MHTHATTASLTFFFSEMCFGYLVLSVNVIALWLVIFCDVRKPVAIQTYNQQAFAHKSTKPKPQWNKPANPYERVRKEKIILIKRDILNIETI